MGYREVTMLEIKEVLRLWCGGAAKKRIAVQLGLDIKTVRRYLRAAQACGVRPGGEAPSEEQTAAMVAALQPGWGRRRGDGWGVCAGQRAFIASHLEHGVRLSKIRRLLRRRGIQLSYAALRRYAIAELGFGRVTTTIPVADGGPGDELQIDTGWMTYLEPDLWGRRRRLRAWIFTPGVSRYRFVYPCFPETTASAIEACEAAWEFYGGVFRTRPGAPSSRQGPHRARGARRARRLLRRRAPAERGDGPRPCPPLVRARLRHAPPQHHPAPAARAL